MEMDVSAHRIGTSYGLSQFDAVLPSQYLQPPRKQAPEHRLMMAVFHDALECLEKYRFATKAPDRQLFDHARHWFVARDTDWPYSFEYICEVLDLDSDAVRRCLSVAEGPSSARRTT